MLKKKSLFYLFSIVLVGCATVTPPPKWNVSTKATEAEYVTYLKTGTGIVMGQAFLVQQGGGVVKAAGSNVTLDPATTTGHEWWGKAGTTWIHRSLTPPSVNFMKARRSTVADADGKFKFTNIPAGKYYVRTDVTWVAGSYGAQGGLVGTVVEVEDGKVTEVILNQYAK